jgi:hypothetical protein
VTTGLGLQGAHGDGGPPAGSEGAKKYRMNPHLQLQCGPMLRYDTVDTNGTYHAFAMIVAADTGSDYSATPSLTYRFTPRYNHRSTNGDYNNNNYETGQAAQEMVFKNTGQKIWTFHSLAGPNSFWRFKFEIKLADEEMKILYCIK